MKRVRYRLKESDGTDFTVYHHDDPPTTLSNDSIYGLLDDFAATIDLSKTEYVLVGLQPDGSLTYKDHKFQVVREEYEELPLSTEDQSTITQLLANTDLSDYRD